MTKKWNKLVARIQALEDAVAALLSSKSTRKKARRKKAKKKTATKKARRKTASRKATQAAKSGSARKPARSAKKKPKRRKSALRVAVAEAAPILPQAPVALL